MIRCAGERRLDGLHPARGDEQRNATNDPESSDDADQACEHDSWTHYRVHTTHERDDRPDECPSPGHPHVALLHRDVDPDDPDGVQDATWKGIDFITIE